MKNITYLSLIIAIIIGSCIQKSNTNKTTNVYHRTNIAILQKFSQYPIVAVDDGQHQSVLGNQWLKTLIGEKEFPESVKNIVVEFGTSKYQWVMDDFVNGKEVPDSLFKKCWRETTQQLIWDNPVYEQFFREVRKINLSLSKEKRIRVLLGDPPFDEERKSKGRDTNAFSVIEKEVLAKNQKALVIYGCMHLESKLMELNYPPISETPKRFLTLFQLLELKYPNKTFNIWNVVNTNDSLTLAIIKNEQITKPAFLISSQTQLGNVDFTTYYPYDYSRVDTTLKPIDKSEYKKMAIKDIFFGILYLGSWEELNYVDPLPDYILDDTVYLNELIRRTTIVKYTSRLEYLLYQKLKRSNEFLQFVDALQKGDTSLINSEYKTLKKRHPDINWMSTINTMGYDFLEQKQMKKAISAFELAVREYPDEVDFYDSLGDGYAANGEINKAIISYEEVIRRDSDYIKMDANYIPTKTKLAKLRTSI